MESKKYPVCFATITLLLSSQLAFFLSPAFASPVEDMLKTLPDNTFAFIATSGGENLNPVFKKSTLGAIWYDQGTQQFYQSIKNELLRKINQQLPDPNKLEYAGMVGDLVTKILQMPIVVGSAGNDNSEIPFYAFGIADAGSEKEEIETVVKKVEQLFLKNTVEEIKIGQYLMHGIQVHGIQEENASLYWGWAGSYFVFTINDTQHKAVEYLDNKDRPDTGKFLENVPGSGDALTLYVDVQKILDIIGESVAKRGNQFEQFNKFETTFADMGFGEISNVTVRIGFDGSDLVSNGLIDLDGPPAGIFTSFEPIDMKLFDLTDKKAFKVSALNLNFNGLYDTVMATFEKTLEQENYQDMQQELKEFEQESGFEIRDELLESLAGPMLFYVIPAGVMMESPQGGFVIIAKLKDKALFEKTINAVEELAAQSYDGKIQISTQKQNDRTIHTLVLGPAAMMQIMPTWTIVDEYLVVAMNPPLSSSAVNQIASPTGSIRSVENFKKVTDRLPPNIVSFTYSDSKIQFKQMMTKLQQFWPMITMTAAGGGIKLPVILPSLSHITDDIQPASAYSWFDEKGLRSFYKGCGVEQNFGAVAGVAGFAVLIPALTRTRPRQVAYRVISRTNLSAIGKACLVYANDYEGEFPPNLETLIETVDLSPKSLESKYKPEDSNQPSYIYITGQNAAANPQNVLVYENPKFDSEGVNVLFLDSHVQWLKPEEFKEALEKTYERLEREMPQVEFGTLK